MTVASIIALLAPIVGGLVAASGWAFANVASRRAADQLGTPSTVAITTSIGLLVAIPIAILGPALPPLALRDLLFFACAGCGGVVGLLFAYRAFRVGRVALVAPIISTQGAVAAALAVLAGESLRPLTAAMLAVVAVGVVLVAIGSSGNATEVEAETGLEVPADAVRATVPDAGLTLRVLVPATLGALCFGLGMFGTGQLAGSLPLGWVALPSRIVGVLAVALPLLGTRRLRVARPALPLVLAIGLADIGAILVFSLAARENQAVASVFGSQTAVVSALGAYAFLRERPTLLQGIGLVVVGVGAAALSLSQI